MTTEIIDGKSGYKTFEKVSTDVYSGNKFFKEQTKVLNNYS